MSGIPAGRSYRIRNQRSNLYLNVSGFSPDESAYVEQYRLQTGNNRASQIWHVFPLDYGKYLFANKSSGLVMNVKYNSTAPSTVVEQFRFQAPNANPAQHWMLNSKPEGAFEVVNDRSQLVLNVSEWSTAPSVVVEQYTRTTGPMIGSQRWFFEVEDEYKPVLALADLGAVGPGQIHRMTSYQPTPSDKTEPVQVGAMAYPFPLVRDPANDRRRQARENPYYILRRFSFWERVYSYEHSGASNYTHTDSTTVGLTRTDSQAVQKTTGISVTSKAELGFSAGPAGGVNGSASLSSTISHELKVTTTHEEVKTHSKTEEYKRTYEAGKRVTEAIWFRSDKYVLERLDGSVVIDWTTREPNTSITDAYPAQG
ncbi:RICIN domain-containing protein [Streptomyces sp. NPDC017520]|uniref:RICIN domain-containing protein n=1 Tax=Streptomyces sp. NPDC017520 TaxID=3364998 RepID=UPI0037B8EEAA